MTIDHFFNFPYFLSDFHIIFSSSILKRLQRLYKMSCLFATPFMQSSKLSSERKHGASVSVIWKECLQGSAMVLTDAARSCRRWPLIHNRKCGESEEWSHWESQLPALSSLISSPWLLCSNAPYTQHNTHNQARGYIIQLYTGDTDFDCR